MIFEHMHLTLIFPLSSLKSQNIIILRYKYKKTMEKRYSHLQTGSHKTSKFKLSGLAGELDDFLASRKKTKIKPNLYHNPHPQKAQKVAVPLNIRVKARIKGGGLKICCRANKMTPRISLLHSMQLMAPFPHPW